MRKDFFSASDAAKKFGDVLDCADREPVTIRRFGKPRAVVIGWRLFQEYRSAYDEAMDDRLVALLEKQLQAAIDGRLATSDRIRTLAQRLMRGEAMLSERAPGEARPETDASKP